MLTCYCKKCDREVPVGDTCPGCGGKLSPTKAHAVWSVERLPVADWLCWNAPMRLILPVAALVLVVSTGLEAILGGWAAVEALYLHGFGRTVLLLTLLITALVGLNLLLCGRELVDCTVDNRGVQIRVFLPDPTPLKLLMRLHSPKKMAEAKPDSPLHEVLVSQNQMTWGEVRRVQFWPGRDWMLFYAPRYLLRLALPCTPYGWEDACDFLTRKLGKKKNVILPPSVRPEEPAKGKKKPRKAASKPAARNRVVGPQRRSRPNQDNFMTNVRAMNEELNRQDRQEAARDRR